MAAWEGLIAEVEEFIVAHRESYALCNKDLQDRLNVIRHLPEISGLIYAVYCRADKQQSDSLKKIPKIAEKLHAWRVGKADTKVIDLHDIIGATIVVSFPSDIDKISEVLSRPGMLQNLRVDEAERVEKDGYRAIHLRLTTMRVALSGVRAEIQIKTMLHDGWGAKTHDLTYKPRGKLGEDLKKHMNILGDVLRQLDDQSEILKNAIHQHLNADAKRRKAARESLLGSGLHDADDDIKALLNDIQNNKAVYEIAPGDSPEVRVFDQKFSELKKIGNPGYTRGLCRALTLFASYRVTGDYNAAVFNSIADWVKESADPQKQVAPMLFLTVASHSLGQLDKAVSHARALMAHCKDHKLGKEEVYAQSNLAYFLSEFAFSQPKPDIHMTAEAKKLSEEALNNAADDQRGSTLDTRGAVLIAWGDNEAEVREGLQNCEDACKLAPDDRRTVAEAFLTLHQRRAYRRLLEWE